MRRRVGVAALTYLLGCCRTRAGMLPFYQARLLLSTVENPQAIAYKRLT